MDPCTFEFLPGSPLSAAFLACGNQRTPEFDDAYLRAIDAHDPLPPLHFAPAPVHHAAELHDSIELPAMRELFTAALLDAHVIELQPAVEMFMAPRHPVQRKRAAPASGVAASQNSAKRPRTCALLPDYNAHMDANLREMEKNVKQRPSPDYLTTVQGDQMSRSIRQDLVYWIDDFSHYFDLAPGTLHRAVSYVDRFLSLRTLSTADMHYELRLLRATALYTAAKYEERCTKFNLDAVGIAELCRFDTAKDVTDMESNMLAVLQYELGGPTVYTFVEHFTRHSNGEQDLEIQRLAHDLAESSVIDYELLQLLPSAVAASAVFLARLILNPKAIQVRQWNKDFEELTGYKPTDLILGIQSLHISNPDPRFEIWPVFLQEEYELY
ncbi:cyclin-F2-2-like [Lolium rigidum]|jgi:cyclin A|uniref:cyclin-F2-2-like n=1 Tax=Lolium rigidum TaxID=89674 RepID=UPI001F5D52BC|nr:cyclin-F2-2-like [Lolium rigidum]